MSTEDESNLSELTTVQIENLPIPLRPGYIGEDDEGPYKVDVYGRKRRPFQKGGPSPNYRGRGAKPQVELTDPAELVNTTMKSLNVDDPISTLLKMAYKDTNTLRAMKIQPKSITPNMQKSILENIAKILYKPKSAAELKAQQGYQGSGEGGDDSDDHDGDTYDAILDIPDNDR